MRRYRFLFALVFAVAACLQAGCVAIEHSEVVELRKLHTAYRSAVVPRPDLDAAKVAQLGQGIDEILAEMEALTK